ncbi:MAG: DUF4367 domain-containing protein, partial [Christensenellales bacterium]
MKAENNFNRALREAVSGELSDAILHEAKIPHTFSDGFLRKMDKLTKAEKSRFWRMTSTVPKRFAVIMASLLIITLTACSIPSVRAAVVGFIKETYDNCVRLFTGDVGSNKISDQYGLTELPDGFTETDRTESNSRRIVSYQNANGNQIILTQNTAEDYSVFLDNENGKLSEITLSDMNISVYKSDDCTVGIWLQDEYAFHLTVYGDYDMDFIMKL